MTRIAFFVYGLVCYLVSLGTFLYAVGFIGNVGVPVSIDSRPLGPTGVAVATDLGLLLLFALQHSVMARPAFKRWWTRIVPEPIERATYVLASSLALILLFWAWRPLGGVVWDVAAPAARAVLHGLYGMGWGLVLVSTFLINHFDLFGLRQVWLHLHGEPYTHLRFSTPGPYRWVRHPLYVGWLTVFWATPTMTLTHLFFALVTTGYILSAIRWEERDLVGLHGSTYETYRKRVPMLIPRLRRSLPGAAPAPAA